MNILFIGDIVGKVGRRIINENLHKLIDKYYIDFCIANVENAAGGFGVTPQIANQLIDSGIHVLTSGNHIWDKKEILDYLNNEPRLLRPANYPEEVPGSGSFVGETASGEKIGVINISGRVFISNIDCPFKVIKKEIEQIKTETNLIIVDVHAEVTSEKSAMGWYLDGEVSAVLGTHTHVQTADEKILPQGTAYISDVGMTGPINSVIGIKKEIAIQKFITQMPKRFEIAAGPAQLNAVFLKINSESGKAEEIKRIQLEMK